MRMLALQSGFQSGVENMALDEAALEWVRSCSEPTLLIRTYCWEVPTLSLGVNQQVRDIDALLSRYGGQDQVQAIVQRPTGGRAILHGKDISYSFVTNAPEVLRKSLKDAYALYADIVEKALETLGVTTLVATAAKSRDYLRSPVCFETHTPSDLLDKTGQKISGAAQLRRSGGILQHGAAFLQGYGISEAQFFNALCQVAEQRFQQPVSLWTTTQAQEQLTEWVALRAVYGSESRQIWDRASTTSGSHLEPASF